jgi:hypothetical protein
MGFLELAAHRRREVRELNKLVGKKKTVAKKKKKKPSQPASHMALFGLDAAAIERLADEVSNADIEDVVFDDLPQVRQAPKPRLADDAAKKKNRCPAIISDDETGARRCLHAPNEGVIKLSVIHI